MSGIPEPGILGQGDPAATTWTLLYTCPPNKSVSGTLYVCNRSGAARTFRVCLTPSGAARADSQAIAWDEAVADPAEQRPLSMAEGDAIWVYVSDTTVGFTFMGTETQV